MDAPRLSPAVALWPRAESVAITRAVFGAFRTVFDLVARVRVDYAWTDRVLSLYAPVALLALPLTWLGLVFVGLSLLLWAAGEGSFPHSMEVAGSSLLTLGFTKPQTGVGVYLAFLGAAVAIAIVVLLLVTYLPTMYAAFADRERLVTLLESRAGSPPTGVEFVERMARIRGLGSLDPIWEDWEEWFARVQESHTSQPALVFFRSQRRDQSWIVAAGALLDAASLFVSCVDHGAAAPDHEIYDLERGDRTQLVRVPAAEVCIRAGYLCLRNVAVRAR